MAISVPTLSSNVDPEVRRAFSALVQQLDGMMSGRIPVGRATAADTTSAPGGGAGATTPRAVTDLTATGAFNTIIVEWNDGQSRDSISYYEVYRATTDAMASAELIGTTSSKKYADTPSDSSTAINYYYWVRPVSSAENYTPGPFNSASGTVARTSTDPTYVIEVLKREITDRIVASQPLTESYIQAARFAIINPETGPKTITSITRSGTTATVTCTAHGFTTGKTVIIAAVRQPEYNGAKLITVIDPDTFSFQVVNTVSTPAVVDPDFSNMVVLGSAAQVPFIVVDGVVYLDTAMIKSATITNAMIESLSADKITTGYLAVARLEGGTITGDKLYGATLEALKAYTGALTVSGALTMADGGVIKSGQTGYRNGRGYWIETNSGVPRISIGDMIQGSHTGSNNASVLTDSTKNWTANALVGYSVLNLTDGSRGVITANTSTTVTASLRGGTQNDWDTDENYVILYGMVFNGTDLSLYGDMIVTGNIEASGITEVYTGSFSSNNGNNTAIATMTAIDIVAPAVVLVLVYGGHYANQCKNEGSCGVTWTIRSNSSTIDGNNGPWTSFGYGSCAPCAPGSVRVNGMAWQTISISGSYVYDVYQTLTYNGESIPSGEVKQMAVLVCKR